MSWIMRFQCLVMIFLLFIAFSPCWCIFIIVPEDVPTGFAGIYGFSPKLLLGRDHRVGFGFRFGNHADLQVMYELGPQMLTKPLQPSRVRSATIRQRVVRRRPFIELLFRAGLLKDTQLQVDVESELDEPR